MTPTVRVAYSIFVCAVLLAASCGGESATDGGGGGGSGGAADAGGDANGDADADVLPNPCSHRQPCGAEGASCVNDCDQPCQCITVALAPEWRCVKPTNGSSCAPTIHTECAYPPDFNEDIDTCRCTAPAGEPFWQCSKSATVCPNEQPTASTACDIPMGFYCFYSRDDGTARTCVCEQAPASGKLWACEP